MLKVHTPKNMNGTIEEVLLEAGRPIVYVSEDEMARVRKAEDSNEDINLVLQLRSGDIPTKVRQYGHIGIVGSDWMREIKTHYPATRITVLDRYEYFGREEKFAKPTLDLIVRNNLQAETTATLPPGIVSGEYKYLMIKHFEENGWDGRIVEMGMNGAPEDAKDYIQFCERNGFMGIDINHGAIGEIVAAFGHYGFMVDETGKTAKKFGVKSIAVIENIEGLLIADPDALEDKELAAEIYRYRDDLRRAYDELHFDPEVHRGVYEAEAPAFSQRER